MDQAGKNMRNTFFTQVNRTRPTTSYISRNKSQLQHQLSLDPQIDPSQKLKLYKEEIKKLEHEYKSARTRLNENRKMIDKSYRDSQKKKIQFLNLYQNRKLKLFEEKLLEKKEEQQKKCRSELRQRAKTIKLNNQIRSLLIKNDLEQKNGQLCLKNYQDKKNLKQQIIEKRQIGVQHARRSFSKIKASETEKQQRVKRVQQIQMALAKQNYFKKLQKELKVIENIDQQINLTCNRSIYGNFTDDKSLFITDKVA